MIQRVPRAEPAAPVLAGLTLGGLLAVLLAAFIVRSLPLDVLRWLVVIVVTYAAVAMLRSVHLEAREPARRPHPTLDELERSHGGRAVHHRLAASHR